MRALKASIYNPQPSPLPEGIGIYTSIRPFSLEGEGRDEGEYKQLILFSSPQPSPAGEGLGDLATHCFCYIEKLCRYFCPKGEGIFRDPH
jgi:hypothetical protein